MTMSRIAAAMAFAVMPVAVSAQSAAERAIDEHRALVRAAIEYCGEGDGDEIVVCGEREESEDYRLPFDVVIPGDPDNETVMQERVRLQANPGTCQHWSLFRAFCGAVGVSAGIGGGRPAGLRPRED